MTAPRFAARALAAALLLSAAQSAHAQSGYYASIAYSQSTGRIGFSARQARTKPMADAYAMRMCASPDAKVFMWGRDQWVAIGVIDGHVGTAGFGRGNSADEAQQKALAEVAKRAHGNAQRVALCVHSSGRRIADRQLRRVAAEPAKSATGFFAALAYSPSTGKIGKTAGKARTVDDAKRLALADCGEADAKAFMWGDRWIAIAVAPDKPSIAGFGPGATREEAEQAARAQCTKFAKGAPVEVALVLYSTGEDDPVIQPVAAEEPAAPAAQPAPAQRRVRR